MVRTLGRLIGYDIRALRIPIAVWVSVLLLQIALLAADPYYHRWDSPGAGVNLSLGLLVVRVALTVLMGALIIQQDSPVGTTAFWQTRPIPSAAIWGSKLAAATLLLVLFPAVVATVCLLALGLTTGAALAGAWNVMVEQALVVSCTLIVASITPNLSRFVLTGLAILVVWAYTNVANTAREMLPRIEVEGREPVYLIFVALLVCGAIAAVAHQYATRRLARTIGIVAMAFIGTSLALLCVKPIGAHSALEPVGESVVNAAAVSLNVVKDSLRTAPLRWRATGPLGPPGQRVWATLDIAGAPASVLFEPFAIEAKLRLGSGRTIAWSARAAGRTTDVSYTGAQANVMRRHLESVVKTAVVPTQVGVASLLTGITLVEIGGESVPSVTPPQSGSLDASVQLLVSRYVMRASGQVSVGQAFNLPDRRLRIEKVTHIEGSVRILIAGVDARGMVRRIQTDGPARDSLYVLRNTALGQAVLVTGQRARPASLTLGLARDEPGTGLLELACQTNASPAGFTIDDQWLAGAELVILEREELGTIRRPLRMDYFAITPSM